ncbi:MAG: PA domain-containing protein [Saprospiraceae bacterium]
MTALFVDPTDENIIVAGAENGGVWKTVDGGENWQPLLDNFSNLAVESLTYDPNNADTYYFGSTSGRIYKSTDAGLSWNEVGTAGASSVRRLLINPDSSNIMFACSQYSGLYRSSDYGDNWSLVSNESNSFDVEFNPENPDIVYASGKTFEVSSDGGRTFANRNESDNNQIITIVAPEELNYSFNAIDNKFSPGHIDNPEYPEELTGKLVLFEDKDTTTITGCGEAENGDNLLGNIAVVYRGDCGYVTKVLNAQNYGAIAVIVVNLPNLPLISMSGSNEEIQIPAVMISEGDGQILMDLMAGNEITIKLQVNDDIVDSSFDTSGPKVIGVSADDPDVVYVLESKDGIFNGFYISYNRGINFVKPDHEGYNYLGYSSVGDDESGQAPRNLDITVNPNNADEVHVGGILTWRSTDGGYSFESTSNWVPNTAAQNNLGYCHADINRVAFFGDKLFAVTDGGIFRCDNPNVVNKNYYTNITDGMGIRHFYKIGVSQEVPVTVSGGAQDNGTSWYNESTGWHDWIGADGMESFVDKDDSNVLFGTIQYGGMYKKLANGQLKSINAPDDGTGNWVTPFEQDPIISNGIYVGFEAVYKSTNAGVSWTKISQDFDEKLDNLKIAPTDNSVMYASYGSNLYFTNSGGGTWSKLKGFSGEITSIAISPNDPGKVALATTSTSKVYVSDDYGSTWIAYTKDLPVFQPLALVWDDNEKWTLCRNELWNLLYQ